MRFGGSLKYNKLMGTILNDCYCSGCWLKVLNFQWFWGGGGVLREFLFIVLDVI